MMVIMMMIVMVDNDDDGVGDGILELYQTISLVLQIKM